MRAGYCGEDEMQFPSDRVLDHLRRVAQLPDLSGTRYELGEELGRGGMGVVYAARDARLDRHIAVKVIDPDFGPAHAGTDAIEEAKILARLEHPGIVPIYDSGTLPDGRVYYAMRLVRGERLDAFLAREDSLLERLRVFQKVCDVVAFAHQCGIIHRDLKPQNVMVGSFGEVFVIDWGVAEWLVGSGGRRPETVVGTRRYMAPEQAGERPEPVDGRADIFSLGAILDDVMRGDRPRPLAAIANKALVPDPEERYQHVQHLAADLTRFLDRLPVSAYEENLLERALRFAERNKILLLLLATYAFVRFALFFLSRH
ncbi:MAG: serine/threonine-protein kinase [Bryobacteraceae bacterium]